MGADPGIETINKIESKENSAFQAARKTKALRKAHNFIKNL